MRKVMPNYVLLRPMRSLRDLPAWERQNLLKQMKIYLCNCELEDLQLRMFKERVNR